MGNKLDKFSEAYDTDFYYSLENKYANIFYPTRIPELKGNSVLELGLGNGFVANVVEEISDNHVVIEGSPELIRTYHENYPDSDLRIVKSYFEDFETEERFDVILMGFILEHVDNPKIILEKYKKILKTDGCIYVTVPNFQALNKRIGYYAGLIEKMDTLTPGDLALGHQRLYSVETLKKLISSVNCRMEKLEGILLKPITTGQMNTLNFDESIYKALLEIGIQYPELSWGLLAKILPI